MKIGLLTYHVSTNHGAMLQTYATCRALKELGHEVCIVDIRQPEVTHTNPIAKLVVELLYIKCSWLKNRFRKLHYPKLTRHYRSVEELRKDPPEVDCLIVGSDQTWNPNIAKDVTMAYFLDFGASCLKRLSYASSFGISEWPKDSNLTADVKRALDRFSALSVRESTGVGILKETFHKDATLVVDPTMLFTEYNELIGGIKELDEIVCYKLNRNAEFFEHIGEVKAATGMPIRLLNNSSPVKGLKYTYPPSVERWIETIGGAKYVITDSFHGCVFSILYKRNFAAIKNHNGKDSRMLDLLSALGLEDRAYDSVEHLGKDLRWMQPIDYSKVDSKLEVLRKESWNYLRNSLDEDRNK